jgi:hypothetical protein
VAESVPAYLFWEGGQLFRELFNGGGYDVAIPYAFWWGLLYDVGDWDS